jgi:hypothetical protein
VSQDAVGEVVLVAFYAEVVDGDACRDFHSADLCNAVWHGRQRTSRLLGVSSWGLPFL